MRLMDLAFAAWARVRDGRARRFGGNAAVPGCPVPDRRLAGHHQLRDTASIADTTRRKPGFPFPDPRPGLQRTRSTPFRGRSLETGS